MRTSIPTDAIFPMPVLMIATYNPDGSVDCMNAAWGTMLESDQIILNLSESHRTVQNILARGAFTVSLADERHVKEADYLGIVSANDTPDKFRNSGLTAEPSALVDAPIVREFPLCMECQFIEYQDGAYGCGVIGKIVRATVEDTVLTDGQVDISKLGAVAFDPITRGYYRIGDRVGEAFRDGLDLR